jgi:hypothetical protein
LYLLFLHPIFLLKALEIYPSILLVLLHDII